MRKKVAIQTVMMIICYKQKIDFLEETKKLDFCFSKLKRCSQKRKSVFTKTLILKRDEKFDEQKGNDVILNSFHRSLNQIYCLQTTIICRSSYYWSLLSKCHLFNIWCLKMIISTHNHHLFNLFHISTSYRHIFTFSIWCLKISRQSCWLSPPPATMPATRSDLRSS